MSYHNKIRTKEPVIDPDGSPVGPEERWLAAPPVMGLEVGRTVPAKKRDGESGRVGVMSCYPMGEGMLDRYSNYRNSHEDMQRGGTEAMPGTSQPCWSMALPPLAPFLPLTLWFVWPSSLAFFRILLLRWSLTIFAQITLVKTKSWNDSVWRVAQECLKDSSFHSRKGERWGIISGSSGTVKCGEPTPVDFLEN